jgi:long-subunit fatty acid transport protein
MTRIPWLPTCALLAVFLTPGVTRATGFEKPIVLSGRYGGLGGAAISGVEGAEALVFNPAGLARSAAVEVELATSPFVSRKAGPVQPEPGSLTRGSSNTWGASVLAAPGGAFASARLREDLGVGVGFFAVAGGGGKYGNVDPGPAFPSLRPELSGGLAFNELSVGAGYEPVPGLRFGAAWRVTFVQAFNRGAVPVASGAAGPVPDTLYALQLEDLSATQATGFRLGVQLEPEGARWGLGAGLRTKVGFTATGRSSAVAERAGSPDVTPIAGGKVTLRSSLPWQAGVGGHVRVTKALQLVAQYELTRSSDVRELRYGGDAIGVLDPAALTIPVEWKDMHTFRAGVEYAGFALAALRAGYALSTQVTPTDRASYGGVPPGPSHTFTVGAGHQFLRKAFAIDAALDVSRDAGPGRGSTPGFLDGDYQLWAVTAHTALAYRW